MTVHIFLIDRTISLSLLADDPVLNDISSKLIFHSLLRIDLSLDIHLSACLIEYGRNRYRTVEFIFI